MKIILHRSPTPFLIITAPTVVAVSLALFDCAGAPQAPCGLRPRFPNRGSEMWRSDIISNIPNMILLIMITTVTNNDMSTGA